MIGHLMGVILSRNPWQRRTIPVQEDMPCVYCGYNLRGLALSARCPECGGSIWDALLRQDIPAIRSCLTNAAIACLALAGWPLILAMLIALSPTAQTALPAGVMLLLANAFCMIIGAGIWVWMPIAQFQPGNKEQERILVLTALTFIGVTAAGIYAIAIGMGAPAAGAASSCPPRPGARLGRRPAPRLRPVDRRPGCPRPHPHGPPRIRHLPRRPGHPAPLHPRRHRRPGLPASWR